MRNNVVNPHVLPANSYPCPNKSGILWPMSPSFHFVTRDLCSAQTNFPTPYALPADLPLCIPRLPAHRHENATHSFPAGSQHQHCHQERVAVAQEAAVEVAHFQPVMRGCQVV
ncbi:unnamed protein product, partial [Ectocarpus sp. 12 AP-2014]